jgi:hypothetical protein
MKKIAPTRLFVTYSFTHRAYKAENEEYGQPPYIIGTYDEVIDGLKEMFNFPEGYKFRLDSPLYDRPVWEEL